MSEAQRARVEQKLRFAKLHLEELAAAPTGRGDDFERAHYEAVLSQLLGTYDAFLGELNLVLGCGRAAGDVTLGKLRESLMKQGRSSEAVRRLYAMQEDETCWLRQLQDLRHASTHRSGIPLAFHMGGPRHGKVVFKHPATLDELPTLASETLEAWWDKMVALVAELRELAVNERAG